MDVDTVEEGSEILILDDGGLLNSGADLGDIFEVDSFNGEVVLVVFLPSDDNSLGSIDALVHFEAQEVLNLDSLLKNRFTLPFSMTFTMIGK